MSGSKIDLEKLFLVKRLFSEIVIRKIRFGEFFSSNKSFGKMVIRKNIGIPSKSNSD